MPHIADSLPLACDVLVCGGGPSGLAAAVAAARAGARVVLLERYGFLGGLATAGLVGTVCGLYLRDAAAATPAPVDEGFPREFAGRLAHASATEPLRLKDGLWVLPYAPWAFERLADSLVAEHPAITPVLHATLAGVTRDDARITQVRVLAWGEELILHPAAVIDATGDATAAALAGAPTHGGLADQAPALVFIMENADPAFVERGMVGVLRALTRAVQEGRLPVGCERLGLIPAPGCGGRVTFKLTLDPAAPGRPDWEQLTVWERDGRARIDQIQNFLIDHAAEFRHARLALAAPQLGVRAGRRIRGRATLAEADVLSCRKHPDAVARGAWPIERWGALPRPALSFFAEKDYYDIPPGCLRPAGLDNVWVTGRALSADAAAQASARVIGTALATGWAAGLAAAEGKPAESSDLSPQTSGS